MLIAAAHAFDVGLTCQMNNVQVLNASEHRAGRGQRVVDTLGRKASAHHQHGHTLAGAAFAQGEIAHGVAQAAHASSRQGGLCFGKLRNNQLRATGQ